MLWWTYYGVFGLLFSGVRSNIIDFELCQLPETLKKEIAGYQGFVNKLTAEVTNGKYKGKFFDDLASFVDKYGNRMSGTANLEQSIRFIAAKAIANGLNTNLEPVSVPYWVRGEESATLIRPRVKKLNMLGLGYSVGTNASGITADVIVVSSFEELEKKAAEVKGKIVLFNNVPYISYGTAVKYRTQGAPRASRLGAVGALVRSVTPFSINSPHTGTVRFAKTDKKIPAAAITLEDADMMARLYKEGVRLVVNLKMEAKNEEDQISHNLVADWTGSKLKDHYVTVSGHIDSWDVGEGALDDGVGAFLGLHSILVLKSMNLPPPMRTLRAIMWTAEEQGLIGAEAYLEKHKGELHKWSAALESDSGLYKPLGLSFNGTNEAYCIMKEIVSLFKALNATQVKMNPWVGSDIAVFQPYGVPLADPLNGDSNYMWYHHTDGDSMRAMNSTEMDENLVVFAGTSYILANLSVQLPRKGQSVWDMMRNSKFD